MATPQAYPGGPMGTPPWGEGAPRHPPLAKREAKSEPKVRPFLHLFWGVKRVLFWERIKKCQPCRKLAQICSPVGIFLRSDGPPLFGVALPRTRRSRKTYGYRKSFREETSSGNDEPKSRQRFTGEAFQHAPTLWVGPGGTSTCCPSSFSFPSI